MSVHASEADIRARECKWALTAEVKKRVVPRRGPLTGSVALRLFIVRERQVTLIASRTTALPMK